MEVGRNGGRASSTALDAASIEAVAQRVVELLDERKRESTLIDAAEVARRYGIARSTVYEKAGDLGAVRLGKGPRARLRFDPETVAERLGVEANGRALDEEAPRRAKPRGRRTASQRGSGGAELLPVLPSERQQAAR
jgi:hypothetical protein